MARPIAGSNHKKGIIDHFQSVILDPKLISDLFYEGSICPHGHRLRHKSNHWCFNCAIKIYNNNCSKDINKIHPDHYKYYLSVFEGLPVDLDPGQCWELPEHRRPCHKRGPRFTALTYRSARQQTTESISLSRLVYFYFWGDVGTLVTRKTCKNELCWNPLHVKSRFNVKPIEKALLSLNTEVDIVSIRDFQSNLPTLQQELNPKLKIIKDPKQNAEVKPGSRYRPLESQFIINTD